MRVCVRACVCRRVDVCRPPANCVQIITCTGTRVHILRIFHISCKKLTRVLNRHLEITLRGPNDRMQDSVVGRSARRRFCNTTRRVRTSRFAADERNKESVPERDTKRDEDERTGNEKPRRATATTLSDVVCDRRVLCPKEERQTRV